MALLLTMSVCDSRYQHLYRPVFIIVATNDRHFNVKVAINRRRHAVVVPIDDFGIFFATSEQ